MNIEKLTNNNFSLSRNGNNFILNLGEITKETDRKTKLRFTDVNSKTFQINGTCGCLTKEVNIIDNNTLDVTIEYTRCDSTFSKVFTIHNNGRLTELTIKGKCQSKSI